MIMKKLQGMVLLGPLAFSHFAGAEPTLYTITDLGTLGGDRTWAWGINASGQVVGNSESYFGISLPCQYFNGSMVYLSGCGDPRAINDAGQITGLGGFLYSGGTSTSIFLGGAACNGFGINNAGQVVGRASGPAAVAAFLYSGGTAYVLNSFLTGADRTNWFLIEATGINDEGWIVGVGYTNPPPRFEDYSHAILLRNGQVTDLGTLGGPRSRATAINNAGQVVGVADYWAQWQPVEEHAFLWSGTNMVDLWGAREALALNNAGHVVGSSQSGAFIYRDGSVHDLHALLVGNDLWRWHLSDARGINDSGQIVGMGTHDGKTRAFLLTPVPVLRPVPGPSPAGFGLSFATITNRNYTVQWSAGFAGWQDLTNVLGTASNVTVLDSSPATSNRFYRVLMP
jgi:probable HAF family extracellular repeat protein